MGTFLNQASCDPSQNCLKQRAVCFVPFYFSGTSTLYVSAIITPTATPGFISTVSCPTNSHNQGRKRRDLEESSDKDVNLYSPVPISASFVNKTKQDPPTCQDSIYFIVILCLIAALVFSTIIILFAICIICKRNKHIST